MDVIGIFLILIYLFYIKKAFSSSTHSIVTPSGILALTPMFSMPSRHPSQIMLYVVLLKIIQLDIDQDNRSLSTNEIDLRARLKIKVLALAMVEREKNKCARISSLKGDVGFSI
jgi:hypothetical protein